MSSLNDAVEHWAAHARSLDDPGPSLPYASSAIMVLAGQSADAFAVGALAILATSGVFDEYPIDLGAARCKTIDSQFYDEHVKRSGARPKGQSLEATWVATDVALYYIAPAIGGIRRWPWSETMIQPGRRGRTTSKFTITTPQGSWQCSTGAVAMANLLTIANWSRHRA